MLAFTRVVMKPGDSRTSTVSFAICFDTCSIAWIVAGALSSAWTISMSFILWTGLKKCIPATRAGLEVEPAISVMLSADVLVAMTARAGAKRSMSAIKASFRSIRSGAASMTKSTSPSASASVLVVDRRPSIASPSAAATLPSSTPFRTIPSMAARPFSSDAAETSNRRVS